MKSINDAIESYLLSVGVGGSDHTAKAYSTGLRRFCGFLETVGIAASGDVKQVTVDHALQFVPWLKPQVSPATLKNYMAAVVCFYRYALREQFLDLSGRDTERLNYYCRLYRKGGRSRLPRLPTEDAVSSMVRAARAIEPQRLPRLELVRLRNIAIVEALRSSGMRIGELRSLKCGDLDTERRTALVMGKGSKERVVFFSPEAWQAMQVYLTQRDGGGRNLSLPVFARHDHRVGKRIESITLQGFGLIFRELKKAAGIETHLTCHSLRHLFATQLLDATGNLALVQDALGHSSPETTRIYAKVSPQQLMEAHRKLFGSENSEGR